MPTHAYVEKCFRGFPEICAEQSPLYAHLSPRIADDAELLEIGTRAQPGQSPVNLIFAGVHDLLLSGVEHDLAAFYPSIGGERSADEAWPHFADFCRRHKDAIASVVATRRVQTNEVGRCGILLPAFVMARRLHRRPLQLIEIGASAGLNLLFDRYRYEYDDGSCCGDDSTVVIRTSLRGDGRPDLPERLPEVAGRIGIDVAPIDVTDADAIRWVEALIWPDQVRRIRLHRAARAIAQRTPPLLIRGDGLTHVAEQVERSAPEAVPCVFHSYATYQQNRSWRDAFNKHLAEIGATRDLVHVSLEWLGDAPGPELSLCSWSGGRPGAHHLGDSDHHGSWLRWTASSSSADSSVRPT